MQLRKAVLPLQGPAFPLMPTAGLASVCVVRVRQGSRVLEDRALREGAEPAPRAGFPCGHQNARVSTKERMVTKGSVGSSEAR